MLATPAVVAGEAEGERDEPHGAEAAPVRQQDQPQSLSPPSQGRRVADSIAIRRGFKTAAKATTAITTGPKPSQRRRSGDAGGLFEVAWRALVRRSRPSQSYATASIFLSEMLDWMNIFVPDTTATVSGHDNNSPVQHDYLSLRL